MLPMNVVIGPHLSLFFLSGTGDQTQSLVHTRQSLYHLNNVPSLTSSFYHKS
jgi:hypothetical protein